MYLISIILKFQFKLNYFDQTTREAHTLVNLKI